MPKINKELELARPEFNAGIKSLLASLGKGSGFWQTLYCSPPLSLSLAPQATRPHSYFKGGGGTLNFSSPRAGDSSCCKRVVEFPNAPECFLPSSSYLLPRKMSSAKIRICAIDSLPFSPPLSALTFHDKVQRF